MFGTGKKNKVLPKLEQKKKLTRMKTQQVFQKKKKEFNDHRIKEIPLEKYKTSV